MPRFYGATTQQNLIAKDRDGANYVSRIEVMNTSTRVAHMTLPRVIRWNLDTDRRCTVRAKLHAGFLKMGRYVAT